MRRAKVRPTCSAGSEVLQRLCSANRPGLPVLRQHERLRRALLQSLRAPRSCHRTLRPNSGQPLLAPTRLHTLPSAPQRWPQRSGPRGAFGGGEVLNIPPPTRRPFTTGTVSCFRLRFRLLSRRERRARPPYASSTVCRPPHIWSRPLHNDCRTACPPRGLHLLRRCPRQAQHRPAGTVRGFASHWRGRHTVNTYD